MNKKIGNTLLHSVLHRLESKEIDISTASVLLGVSERQIYRIKKVNTSQTDKKENKSKKPPSNKTNEATINKIINLYKTKYRQFSYIHFHEKLIENEKIDIKLKTVERILKSNNLISPFATKKTKRKIKEILQSINQATTQDNEQNLQENNNIIFDPHDIHNRHRHIENFGELLQMDARKDFYISDRKWTLHLAIDVASGIFVGAYFDFEETLHGYQHVLHQIITKYGIPKCILTDNRTVFEYIHKGSNQESKNTLIQFKYSCIQLGIKLNTTSVATYKSIIERANGIFGRRLPQELAINNIKSIEDANIFLKHYLDEMNEKFAHDYPGKNVFKKCPSIEILNNFIGTITRRMFDKAACIRFKNQYYYATIQNKIVAFVQGTKALLIHTFDGRIIIVVDSIAYDAINIEDYEYSAEKAENPENELFISKHMVSSTKYQKYKEKHISLWSYYSFEKYVNAELEFINRNYWHLTCRIVYIFTDIWPVAPHGYDIFKKYFQIILTDRGKEFKDPLGIELSPSGEVLCKVFYCDARQSQQKGKCEKNHEHFRVYYPKGTSFDMKKQEDINAVSLRVNNYPRDSLNWKSPFDVATVLFDKKILDLNELHKLVTEDFKL